MHARLVIVALALLISCTTTATGVEAPSTTANAASTEPAASPPDADPAPIAMHDGCSDGLPEELAGILGPIEGVEFDEWKIVPESYPVLDQIAEILGRYPEVEVEIAGHIDAKASELYLRRRPSLMRAEAVRDYLIHAGIEAWRLRAVGYGEEQPIASNETKAGRARNRRVEIRRIDGSWPDNGRCEESR
jgi:outer membrane protein OmpA-like peptidoglycan-associated protein